MVMTSWIKTHSHSVVLLQQLKGRGRLQTHGYDLMDDTSTVLHTTYCSSWKVEESCKSMVMTSRISNKTDRSRLLYTTHCSHRKLQTHGHNLIEQQQNRHV